MRTTSILTLAILLLASLNASPLFAQAMRIDAQGDVGIGIADALTPLHIFRDDATQEFMFLESNEVGTTQDRPMMFLANNGGIRFEFENSVLATAWRFQAATGNQDRFEVTKVGTGRIEFYIDDLGNGFIAGDLDVGGDLTTNLLLPSDISLKQNIQAVDADAVLERVAALPMNSWEYTGRPGERHIGPMAQDFRDAFQLGAEETTISVVDASGVALASIQALESRNRALENTVQQLQARLETLELLLQQQAQQTAAR
jgi:hypothetical protein